MAAPVLALDIGGTKLAAAVVDRGGRVSAAARIDTPHGRKSGHAAAVASAA